MDSDSDEPVYKRRKHVANKVEAGAQKSSKPTKQERPVQSFLARYLLSWFAWGDCSPQTVQILASLAVKDIMQTGDEESVPSELMWLANIGTRGDNPQNMYRQIMAKGENISLLQKPFYANMPFKEFDEPQPQALLLPHETFAALYRHFPTHWKKSILPDTSELKEFWKLQREPPV